MVRRRPVRAAAATRRWISRGTSAVTRPTPAPLIRMPSCLPSHSQMIETLFGDGKQHGGTIRQVKLRGRLKVSDVFTLAMLAVNLRRLPGLLAAQATMVGSG